MVEKQAVKLMLRSKGIKEKGLCAATENVLLSFGFHFSIFALKDGEWIEMEAVCDSNPYSGTQSTVQYISENVTVGSMYGTSSQRRSQGKEQCGFMLNYSFWF